MQNVAFYATICRLLACVLQPFEKPDNTYPGAGHATDGLFTAFVVRFFLTVIVVHDVPSLLTLSLVGD